MRSPHTKPLASLLLLSLLGTSCSGGGDCDAALPLPPPPGTGGFGDLAFELRRGFGGAGVVHLHDGDDLRRALRRHRHPGQCVFRLRLARVGVEFAPEEHRIRDTHAWALFANGLHDEALIESARALELAPEDEKDDYQGYLDRMRAMIEAAQAPASDDD